MNKGGGKIFWKLLEKLRKHEKRENLVEKISLDSWKNYFISLYFDNKSATYPRDSIEMGPLDFEITSRA